MDFSNLESEETLQHALAWISQYIQEAMENKQSFVTFSFSPNEQNNLMDIFEFILKIKDALYKYDFISWCVLDNKNQKITMKVMV